MNQKEVNEIKKTFCPEKCCLTKIAGCYVDTEKSIRTTVHDTFLCLPEEEQFKYFELFKKGLSGKIGKQLINMEFPMSEEEEGGTQSDLMKLLNSGLERQEVLDAFYENVKDTFDYPDNYYILLAQGTYDVPGKTTDGATLDDASDEVYKFILCLFCPIKPSKAGLSYDEKANSIVNAMRNMMVEQPMHGFLFPAFNERSTDIHNVLYYTKKSVEINESITDNLLGCDAPAAAETQDELFLSAVESCTNNLTFDVAKALYENVREQEIMARDQPEPLVLDKRESSKILSQSGIKTDDIQEFERLYDKEIKSEGDILAKNIFGGSDKMKVKSGNTEITLPIDYADHLTLKEIDGYKCLVLELTDDLSINGLKINKY